MTNHDELGFADDRPKHHGQPLGMDDPAADTSEYSKRREQLEREISELQLQEAQGGLNEELRQRLEEVRSQQE